MKDPSFFHGEIVKIRWRFYKNLLLQNKLANFNQPWHKSSLGSGYISLFKWRAPPFSKMRLLRNSENTLTFFVLKSSSPEPEPVDHFQPNLISTKHPLVKVYKFISMKGHAFFQGEIITKNSEPLDQFQPNLAKSIHG